MFISEYYVSIFSVSSFLHFELSALSIFSLALKEYIRAGILNPPTADKIGFELALNWVCFGLNWVCFWLYWL